MIQSPNINIVPQQQVGHSVAHGINALTEITRAKVLDEQEKMKRVHELADVSFTDTNIGNNIEVVDATNKFVDDLTTAASEHRGNIPFAKQAEFMRQKRDLMLLTKRAVEDEQAWHKMMEKLAFEPDKWDSEATMERMMEIRKKPLGSREMYYEALVPEIHLKDMISESMGEEKFIESVQRDRTHIDRYGNDPEGTIDRLWDHNPRRFREKAEMEFNRAKADNPDLPYENAMEYLKGRYVPELSKVREVRRATDRQETGSQEQPFRIQPVSNLPEVNLIPDTSLALKHIDQNITSFDEAIAEQEEIIKSKQPKSISLMGGNKEREEARTEAQAKIDEATTQKQELEKRKENLQAVSSARQLTLPNTMINKSVNIPTEAASQITISPDAANLGERRDMSNQSITGKITRVLYMSRNDAFGDGGDEMVPVIEISERSDGEVLKDSPIDDSVNKSKGKVQNSIFIELTPSVVESLRKQLKNVPASFTYDNLMNAVGTKGADKPESETKPEAEVEADNDPLNLL